MPFWELRVPASAEISEGLTNFLWEQGALGVVEEEEPGGPPRLRAFFPESASSTRLVAAVGEYTGSLAALGLPPPPGEPEILALLDEAWASAWQRSFPPRPVGDRLLVVPPWEIDGEGRTRIETGRLTLIIEPGRAFGTGHHGSTEGCLALLERAVASSPPPARVLDIGTGTGILAVAAVRLGAAGVLAVDVDPDAVAAARRSADVNGCAGAIEAALGGPDVARERAPFDLVLANLLTHTHLALGPEYARLLATGGLLVLGGMLASEDRTVAEALRPRGFGVQERMVVDGWASTLLRRS